MLFYLSQPSSHFVVVAVQYSTNGHYYEVIAAPSAWTSALSAAAVLPSFRGVSGHLATISSSGENSFVQSILNGVNVWVDGSKSGGFWVYSSGPEAGTDVSYFNWNVGSPGGNLCLSMLSSGYLADVGCLTLEYYVVEYECPYGGAFTLTGCSIGLGDYECMPRCCH